MTSDELYNAKAQAVIAVMSQTKGLEQAPQASPILDFIKQLLTTLLPMLVGCFGTKGAAEHLANPGPLTRASLRLAIRRGLHDDQSLNLLARPVYDAVLKVAKTTTEAEVVAMSEESA